MYTEECIQTFLEKQEQLFDEPVAEVKKNQKKQVKYLPFQMENI